MTQRGTSLRVAPYEGAHASEWRRFINASSAVALPCGVTLHIPRAAYTLEALQECVQRQIARSKRPIRLTDLGAGTGQIDAALLKMMPDSIFRIDLVDRSVEQKCAAQAVFKKAGVVGDSKKRPGKWAYHLQDLSRPAPLPESDLVISIHLLSELPDYDLGIFFARVAAILLPGGRLFVETLHPDLIEAALLHVDREQPLVVSRAEARQRWPDRNITSSSAWVFYSSDGAACFPTQNEVHPRSLLMRHASSVGLRLEREITLPIHPEHARVNHALARFRDLAPCMRQIMFQKE